MNLTLLIAGTLLLCIVVMVLTKDFLHPGFLFCIPWIVFLSLLPLSNYDYDGDSLCYFYFLAGTFVFECGCFIGLKKIRCKERLTHQNVSAYYVNYSVLKLIILTEWIFTLYLMYSYFSLIRSHFTINIFMSYYLNQDKINHTAFLGYGRNLFTSFGICMVIGYSRIVPEEQKRYKKYIFLQMIPYAVLTLTRMTRTGMLFAALPLFMAFIVVTRQNNIQVFKKMIVAILAFLCIFGLVAVMKYHTLFSDGNFIRTILDQLILYGSGAFVAFQKKFDSMNFMGYKGANTFRFFSAVLEKITGTANTQPLIQQFSSIGYHATTNVYTFYQWYADDFGPAFALFAQFIAGTLHGFSYRKMSQTNLYGIYVYCLLIHPLIMQIFEDQYCSLMSSWIQFFIAGFLFLKTNLLFSRKANQKGIVLYLAK